MAELTVGDLVVDYGPVRALDGVSMRVPSGAVVAVLGANGAGKTTLLRAVSGTLRFQRGRIARGAVELDGVRLSGLAA
ncbi:ATP-binding cassette domain-containing protein, partial [Nonomuraea wenchangensis]